jgi:hypothetical protein
VGPTKIAATKESSFVNLFAKKRSHVEFQSIFMRLNRQIDVAKWPSFDQKIFSQFRLGIPFSVLNRPSLPQPKRAALLTPLTSINNFVEFQNMFLRMNHQIEAAEQWPPLDQNSFAV